MSEQTENLCTTDACESLRARLAKYEDAEGRPVGLTHDQAELVGLVRDLALRSGKHARPLMHAAALGLESQAREIERLKRSAQTNWNEFAEGLKAQQPSGVVPSVLAECFFHALPDEDEWEVHDPRHMSGDCDGCVQAVIVSRADWERLNSSPASAGGVDERAAQVPRKALADFIEYSVPGPYDCDEKWFADKRALVAALTASAQVPNGVSEIGQCVRISSWKEHAHLNYWSARLVTDKETDLAATGQTESAAILAVMDMFVAGADSASAPTPDALSIFGDTGHAEADRLIGRLTSSDPDFEDCTAAALLLRRLVLEEIKGPKGYATWKDAAVAERLARASMRPSEAVVVMAREGLEVYSGPNMNEHKVCAEIVRLAEITNEARATLSAHSHGEQVRDGWQLVPVDPTNAMTHIGQSLRYDGVNSIGHIYRQMLAAAPSAGSQEQGE